MRDAGVVHQNIDLQIAAQLGQRRQIADVDGVGNAAGSVRQRGQLFMATRDRVDHNPFLTKAFDNRFTHSGGSAGHQGHFII